jgi:lactoylglutathione lyase
MVPKRGIAMPISRVRLVTVYVSNQDRALEFYVGKLGFKVQADQLFGPHFRWLEVVPPGADTALTLVEPYPGQDQERLVGAGAHIVFTTDDIQGTFEELKARGVHFTEEPTVQPWGVTQAQFHDPDGNHFVLVDRP